MKIELHPSVDYVTACFINEDLINFIGEKKTFSLNHLEYIYQSFDEYITLRDEDNLVYRDRLMLREALQMTYNHFLYKEAKTIGWRQCVTILGLNINKIVEKEELISTLIVDNTKPTYLSLYDRLYAAIESRETLNISTLKKIEKAIVAKYGRDLDEVQLDIVKAFFNRYYLFFKMELNAKKYYFLHREDTLRLYHEAKESFKI